MSSQNWIEVLAHARPKKVFSRRWRKRSGVSLVLDHEEVAQASLLLIKRAERQGDPWSGHMAFPGGRYDAVDRNSLATAKREMFEEVGFDIDSPLEQQRVNGRVIGRLSDLRTSRRVVPRTLVVSPYVFLVDRQPELAPNYEVAETLWIPFSFFADLNNRDTLSFQYRGRDIHVPCYRYEGREVWGMSLSMIEELMRLVGIQVPSWSVPKR